MSMESAVRWENPPEGRGVGRGKFNADEVFEVLHKNPGEWAVIAEDVSASYAHTSPLCGRLKDKGCEIRSAKVNGIRNVYARFVPQRNSGARRAA